MKHRKLKRHLFWLLPTLALLGLALPLATSASPHTLNVRQVAGAEDWPTYLHDAQRTAASGETILSTSNASQLTKLWSFKTDGVIAASPAVVGGVVYVGSWDGYEYALNAATGALIWKTYLGVTTANDVCNPPVAGISSGAAVQNGVVYVGGGDAYWYALDATTGAILWKVFTGDNSAAGGHYNWSSPLLYNGYAYIGIASMGDCPLVQGQLLQVSLSTHQVVNTLNLVPNGQVGGGIWTTPSVDAATNTIYVPTGTEGATSQTWAQAILAIDASTLTVKDSWKLPESVAVFDSDFGTSATLFSDTAGDQLVAAIDKNGVAYAFKRNNLSAGPVWQQTIAVGGDCPTCGYSSVSSGAFGGGRLYLSGEESAINGTGHLGAVRALDPATGTILWQDGEAGPVMPALAYNNGLLLVGAGPTFEVLDASTGQRLYSYQTGNILYAAPSVSQGEVFIGGIDGNVYAFGLASPPASPPADSNCPNGWTCQDIGNPTAAGSESVSGGVWDVSASGGGIGGASDQFRLSSESASGDIQITAQVTAQQATGGTAQAGLMLRQTADPASPYYAIFVTPGNQVVVQYRTAFGGPTTVANTVSTGGLPLYLEIQRVGDRVQAATSTDGTHYTLVPGSTATVVMPTMVLAGLAVSSGVNGTTGTATLSNVTLGAPGNSPAVTPSPSPCPSGWNCADVGNPLLGGDQSLSGGTWTVKGAGGSDWYNFDQFHFVWQSLIGDGTISAQVFSQTNTAESAKAGVMLRVNTTEGSPFYAAYITPGKGIVVQYRDVSGLISTEITSFAGAVPTYLEVARSGGTFTAYTSSDGVTWLPVPGTSITLNWSSTLLAGLLVSSHDDNALSTATFNAVTIGASAPPPPTACPTGWNCGDVGNPSIVGDQALKNGVWTLDGGGGDIWGDFDEFRYVWQSLPGDGAVSAQVVTQSNSDPWAKAGVMLRANTTGGSPFYAAFVTPANGIVVQYRTAQDAQAAQSANLVGVVPTYLKVGRSGTTFTAYTSTDGVTWTAIPGSSVTIGSMIGTLLAGMAVTSHNNFALSQVTFNTVTIAGVSSGCPTGWTCGDIGYTTPAGGQSLSNGTWTVQGAGSDIWLTADQFHYVWQSLPGDGAVSAQVVTQSSSDPWAKAGVMLRQSADADAAFYAVLITPGNGIAVQYRASQGAQAAQAANLTGVVPTYLKVGRSGTTFTAYTSADGVTWTAIAGSSVALSSMTGTLLAGLAVTAHNAGSLSTVTFNTVTLTSMSCPTGWTCGDIGYTAPAGGQSTSNGTWTVQGAGSDIWSTADQFHYIWQSLPGNGSVSAQVEAQSNTSSWAKAGVMLRTNTTGGSPFYAVYVTPGNGIVVQYRASQGARAIQLATLSGVVPTYLMVGRSGKTFTSYISSNGVTWTAIAGSSITLGNMTGTLLAGLAVTAHNAGSLSTVTFSNIRVGVPSSNCPTGWTCGDIGYTAPAGGQSTSNGTWTVQGAGSDIWSTADQFHYIWQSLPGNGSVSAQVEAQSNTSSWAKAGVMLRTNTTGGSPFYAVYVTPGNGIVVQYRASQGARAIQLATLSGVVPTYLKVVRSGTTFTAYTSADGVTWTAIAGSSITLGNMTGTLLAGLAVTAHNAGSLSTVTFNFVEIG